MGATVVGRLCRGGPRRLLACLFFLYICNISAALQAMFSLINETLTELFLGSSLVRLVLDTQLFLRGNYLAHASNLF